MTTPIGYEQARAAAARFLGEPVVIYEETVIRDASGGSTTSYVEQQHPSPIQAWIASPSARRAADREADEIASQVENTAAVVCALPNGTQVKEGDLVSALNTWWKVTARLSLSSPRSVTVRVSMREIDPPHPGSIVTP